MEYIVEISGLNKSFGHRQVIKGFSCQIAPRTLVALVGPSGCGKSTILNIIGLLESFDSGTVKINGEVLPSPNSHQATLWRRQTINYLFQSYALINNITVQENLLIAMEFVPLSKAEKQEQIRTILQKLQIAHLLTQPVHTLSGGEQQRVALARCILKPGALILADEPTGSLDPKMSEIVFGLLQSLRDEYGKTVVLVTHDVTLARRADQLIELPSVLV